MKDISKKIAEHQKKLQVLYDKLKKYKEDHSIKGFKAKFIKCPTCGSQIRIDLLQNKDWTDSNNAHHLKLEYMCPVCRKDMRAEYIIEKVFEYESKMRIELLKMFLLLQENGYEKNEDCKVLKGVKLDYRARGISRYDNIMVVNKRLGLDEIGSVRKENDGYCIYLTKYENDGNTRDFVIEDIKLHEIKERYPFLGKKYEELKKEYKIC